MNPQDRKAKELFIALAGKVAPDEWESRLDEACGTDHRLKDRVRKLLEAHAAEDSFLREPAVAATVDSAEPSEALGSVIGPYKLRERIGEGGFGVVYVAEQTEPVRRKVALKIIKPGMDTREIIARFEAERQALAMMDHPNIAKVLDAGTTGENPKSEARNPKQIQSTKSECQKRPGDEVSNIPDSNFEFVSDFGFRDSNFRAAGRPYFVMELVKGIPITEFCDEQKLSTRERLELFVQVCRAVQHAHQKGIIHRDLKPTNVMVTLHDGTPVPKVIDFGVSKALSQQLTEKTVYTAYGQMVGTPLYMSPEQAQLSGIDVDTRSDIYSLGVLLYELLTGTTPFDKETLQKSGFDEMRRIIREVDPPRPSARISTLQAEALSTVSDRRRIDPKQFSHSLRGELDWIAMKALDKDRTRRYETANSLARDVERHLNDEPVHARPPSVAYRLRKFTRRNKTALVTSTLVVAALVVGTAVSIWQAVRATTEAHRASLAEQLAQHRLEQVDKQRQKVEANYQEAERQRKRAEASYQQAEAQRKRAEVQRRRAEANVQLALTALDQVYLALAEAEFEEWMELTGTGEQLLEMQFLEKTLPFYDQLAMQKADDPRIRSAKARAYLRVGNVHRILGRRARGHDEKAQRALRQAVVLLEELVDEFPNNVTYGRRLANSYRLLGEVLRNSQPAEAEKSYRKSLATELRVAELSGNRRVAGRRLAAWAGSVGGTNRGRALAATGDPAKALPIARRAVELAPKETGTHVTLAEQLIGLGCYEEARHAANRAISLAPDAWWLYKRRAEAEFGLQRYPEALASLTKAIEMNPGDPNITTWIPISLVVRCPDDSFRKGLLKLADRQIELSEGMRQVYIYWTRGELHANFGNLARARADFQKAASIEKTFLSSHYRHALCCLKAGDPAAYRKSCRSMLVQFAQTKKPDEARLTAWTCALDSNAIEDYTPAVQLAEQALIDDPQRASHQQCLGAVLYRAGRFQEALEHLEQAVKSEKFEKTSPVYGSYFLAMTHHRLGHAGDAREWLAKANQQADRELNDADSPPTWERRFTLQLLRAETEELMGTGSRQAGDSDQKSGRPEGPAPVVAPIPTTDD